VVPLREPAVQDRQASNRVRRDRLESLDHVTFGLLCRTSPEEPSQPGSHLSASRPLFRPRGSSNLTLPRTAGAPCATAWREDVPGVERDREAEKAPSGIQPSSRRRPVRPKDADRFARNHSAGTPGWVEAALSERVERPRRGVDGPKPRGESKTPPSYRQKPEEGAAVETQTARPAHRRPPRVRQALAKPRPGPFVRALTDLVRTGGDLPRRRQARRRLPWAALTQNR